MISENNGNSGFYMPVAPAYNGGGFGNGGFGGLHQKLMNALKAKAA